MIGGQAYLNGVSFYTDEVWVRASRRKDESIEVEVRKRVMGRDLLIKWFGAIPFVRGLALMGDLFFTHWSIFAVWIVGSFAGAGGIWFLKGIPLLQSALVSDDLVHQTSRYLDWMLFLLISAAFLVIRCTSVSRYHAAEHKVITAYETYNSIERDKVLAASRISSRCGSNFAVFLILCYALLSFFPMLFFAKVLLSYMVGYELFLLDEKGRWGWALAPFYRVSGWLQGCFLTREPRAEDLEVAESALLTLLEVIKKTP